MPLSTGTVKVAKVAEREGRYVSHIFSVFADATDDEDGLRSTVVKTSQFCKLLKHFEPEIVES